MKKTAAIFCLLLCYVGGAYADSGIFYKYTSRFVGSSPQSSAIADLNGDGRNDVAMTTAYNNDPVNDNKLFIFLQQASGQLAEPLKYPAGNGFSVAAGDVNNDGRADIIVTLNNGIGVYLQTASGSLAPMITYGPRRPDPTMTTILTRLSDINGDGRLDVVSLDSNGGPVKVYFQNSGGALDAPVSYPVLHGGGDDLDLGDVNHDGRVDILVMSGQGYAHNFGVLLQQSGGTFAASAYYSTGANEQTSGIAVGDVNGDSLADVVVSNGSYGSPFIKIFYQNSAGVLQPAVSFQSNFVPSAVEIADVNHDGRQDILVLQDGWAALGVFLQNAQGGLQPYELYGLPYATFYSPHSIAVGDISGDGFRDVVVADYNSGLVVLYHRSQSGIPDIVTDRTVDFGSAVVNSTLEKTTYATNNGPSDLVIGSVSITGANQADFLITRDDCSGRIVGISEYCGVVVRFTPQTSGLKDAALSIPSNDPDHPTTSIPMLSCSTQVASDSLFTPYVTKHIGSRPEAVAVGDLNGDGREDVALLTSIYYDPANDSHLFVFLQNNLGGLDPPMSYPTSGVWGSEARSIGVGDVSGDGRKDVVVGTASGPIDVFLQNSTGGLNPATTYATDTAFSITIGDMNNDGRLDVVGIGMNNNKTNIFIQNAGGTLNPPISYAVPTWGFGEVNIGDLNHDGRNDIIVMRDATSYQSLGVLNQNPDGSFGPVVYYSVNYGETTHGFAVGDVNGDALSDLVASFGGNRPRSGLANFLQNTQGSLQSMRANDSYDIPSAVEIGDVSRDGKNDVAVLHYGWGALGVYRQDAVCTLAPEERYPIPIGTTNPQGLALGDINGDGTNDAVVAHYGGDLVLLYHAAAANSPNLSVPSMAVFDKTIIGGAIERTFSIANIGSSALQISSITVGGAASADFTLSHNCTVVPIGAACAVTASFHPSTGGSRTALLSITSNDPDLPVKTVSLTGEGDYNAVTLTAPNGGETLKSGTVSTIGWTAPTGAVRFGLRYSINNGSTWKTIADGLTNSPYAWTVPSVTKTKYDCLVEVTGFNAAGVVVGRDASDRTFTILK